MDGDSIRTYKWIFRRIMAYISKREPKKVRNICFLFHDLHLDGRKADSIYGILGEVNGTDEFEANVSKNEAGYDYVS